MVRFTSSKTSKHGRRKEAGRPLLPEPAPPSVQSHALALQRAAGNRAFSRLLRKSVDGLPVSQPGDSSEREADRVAEQVTASMAGGDASHGGSGGANLALAGASPVGVLRKFGPGRSLEPSTRASMEPHFGVNFGSVRLHTGREASEAARDVDARAFTVGSDVVFGEGEYAPGTSEGLLLLAHELTHVVQQQGQTISRAVSADYPAIEDKLTYGLLDWEITDKEAHDVLKTLSGLAPADLTDTLQAMEKEGLVGRLLENISSADRTAFAALVEKISRQRATADIANHIESLMSYGLLDWVITDKEARVALDALKSLQPEPEKLRDVLTSIPVKQYERFYDNLSGKDRSANLTFLQQVEMIRSSGMTMKEMTAAQKKHLESEAAAKGVSVGEHIRGEAASRGYGGKVPVWWSSLTGEQKKERKKKFIEVVAEIRAKAPKAIRDIIKAAEAAGGGIFFKPDEVEELGAYGYNEGNQLVVGKTWLETADNNIEDVYDNISHELGGHREYGDEASWEIMKGVLAALSAAERTKAKSGAQNPYTAYGYMETEMYAELREQPYTTKGSRSDDPVQDVEDQLKEIKVAFESSVAEAIIRGFRRRIQLDEKVTDTARKLYDEKVKIVFGISF